MASVEENVINLVTKNVAKISSLDLIDSLKV